MEAHGGVKCLGSNNLSAAFSPYFTVSLSKTTHSVLLIASRNYPAL